MKADNFFEYAKSFMEKHNLDLILITKIINVQYLTGFTGTSGYVIVDKHKAYFVTDPRYTQQALTECKGWEIEEVRFRLSDWLSLRYEKARVGIDEWASCGFLEKLKKRWKEAEFVVLFDVVEKLRIRKEKGELINIKKAIEIAEAAFTKTLELLKPGIYERDIALELEYQMKRLGAKGPSFDIIVASGPRSALPHGVASNKRIVEKELVLFDWGCMYNGYCSDMTRVVKLGKTTYEEKRIWDIVNDARKKAIDSINVNMAAKDLHNVAEEVIGKFGLSKYFGHGLGHGIGREIHEKPSISLFSEDTIVENAVFTIEPGIYFPGQFGIRIEDMIYLEKEPQLLTTLTREILEL